MKLCIWYKLRFFPVILPRKLLKNKSCFSNFTRNIPERGSSECPKSIKSHQIHSLDMERNYQGPEELDPLYNSLIEESDISINNGVHKENSKV